MGLNAPVRPGVIERFYPITAIPAAYTSNGILDVERFCRDNNMTPTAILVRARSGEVEESYATVDVALVGRAATEHFPIPLRTGEWHGMAVKRYTAANSNATEVFIGGINP